MPMQWNWTACNYIILKMTDDFTTSVLLLLLLENARVVQDFNYSQGSLTG